MWNLYETWWLPKTQKIKERPWQTKPRSTCDCDMDQQITRTLPHEVRVPRVICRPQSLNFCMSRESYGKLILQASILEFHVSSPVLNDEHGWSWKSCRSMSQFVISLHKNSPRLLDQGFLRDFFFGHCASSKWWQHFSLLRHCMEFFRLLSFLVGEGWGMTHTSLVDGSAAVLCFSTDQKGKSRTDQINGKKHKTTQ